MMNFCCRLYYEANRYLYATITKISDLLEWSTYNTVYNPVIAYTLGIKKKSPLYQRFVPLQFRLPGVTLCALSLIAEYTL